ncbi:alanyl-tRNA editing protein [Fervidicella metallireducens]|nr:DHHA1 domain-containing protein [Fervidicella metallireducens]
MKECVCEIVNIVEKDNKYHLELDRTCFYPEGGGQPSDTGKIDGIPVNYVYEEKGKIYHVVETKPNRIHKVKCIIDWEKRYDNMQQHLGQHIISACFMNLFNSKTIGFHLSDSYTTIDLDKILDSEEIEKVEEEANKIIAENIEVEILYPSKDELRKLQTRRPLPKTEEEIRIVKIGDIDINACCGTHPKSTLEVQLIKIIKWEKYKNGVRIYFLCGNRAIKDYILKHNSINSISKILSCSVNEVMQEVERLMAEHNKNQNEKRALISEIAYYQAKDMFASTEAIDDVKIIKTIFDNTDIKYVELLATKLAEFPKVVILFAIKSQDRVQLKFIRSKELNNLNMSSLLKDAITLIDGKGGGTEYSAQGGGKNNNNLESLMDYAFNKVKNNLT